MLVVREIHLFKHKQFFFTGWGGGGGGGGEMYAVLSTVTIVAIVGIY